MLVGWWGGLGWMIWGGFDIFFSLLYTHTTISVEEVRYEKIKPQLDTTGLNECTEMKFVVPPSSDYFTR
jgi:hypothetical protein